MSKSPGFVAVFPSIKETDLMLKTMVFSQNMYGLTCLYDHELWLGYCLERPSWKTWSIEK